MTDEARPSGTLRKATLAVAGVYLALTFYLGSTPQELVQYAFRAQDKVSHLVFFGLMQWTHLAAAEAWLPRFAFGRLRLGAVLSATAVGGLLEVWQAFLPHRSAEGLDLAADALGAALFALLYRKRRFSREPSVGAS